MKSELEKYKDRVYILTNSGKLKKVYLSSLDDYNHSKMHLHHFIPYGSYSKNSEWYKARRIEQKLILVTIPLHEQIHEQAISNLDDDDFYGRYGIDRWELIFNRKYSKY